MNIEKQIVEVIKEHNLNSTCFLEGKQLKHINITLSFGKDSYSSESNESININKDWGSLQGFN